MVMVRFHFHAHGVCKIPWSWSDSIFMLMVCARFHGHGQIPFSCSWCVQDFMVMVSVVGDQVWYPCNWKFETWAVARVDLKPWNYIIPL